MSDARVPAVDRDSAPWWEGLRRHELLLQRCGRCDRGRWPPRAICGRCGSLEWRWEPATGRGRIASWIVNHHTFDPIFESPYVVVLVRLDDEDDILIPGSFAGADPGALRVGLPVRAGFDDIEPSDGSDGVTLLSWTADPLR